MGKIDDMRRLREEQHEAKQRAHDDKKKAAPKPASPTQSAAEAAPRQEVAPKSAPAPKAKAEPAKSSSTKDEKGECPSCKKQKPLANGVLANHQKGFGKMCPGSRKAPV